MTSDVTARVPSAIAMIAYLGGGVALGLAFVVALLVTRETTASAAVPTSQAVTDDVVHLRTSDLDPGCTATGRVKVAMAIGMGGQVSAHAEPAERDRGSAELARCVERHVTRWEFLPQATATTMWVTVEVR